MGDTTLLGHIKYLEDTITDAKKEIEKNRSRTVLKEIHDVYLRNQSVFGEGAEKPTEVTDTEKYVRFQNGGFADTDAFKALQVAEFEAVYAAAVRNLQSLLLKIAKIRANEAIAAYLLLLDQYQAIAKEEKNSITFKNVPANLAKLAGDAILVAECEAIEKIYKDAVEKFNLSFSDIIGKNILKFRDVDWPAYLKAVSNTVDMAIVDFSKLTMTYQNMPELYSYVSVGNGVNLASFVSAIRAPNATVTLTTGGTAVSAAALYRSMLDFCDTLATYFLMLKYKKCFITDARLSNPGPQTRSQVIASLLRKPSLDSTVENFRVAAPPPRQTSAAKPAGTMVTTSAADAWFSRPTPNFLQAASAPPSSRSFTPSVAASPSAPLAPLTAAKGTSRWSFF
jgi:hypothetical protein